MTVTPARNREHGSGEGWYDELGGTDSPFVAHRQRCSHKHSHDKNQRRCRPRVGPWPVANGARASIRSLVRSGCHALGNSSVSWPGAGLDRSLYGKRLLSSFADMRPGFYYPRWHKSGLLTGTTLRYMSSPRLDLVTCARPMARRGFIRICG